MFIRLDNAQRAVILDLGWITTL